MNILSQALRNIAADVAGERRAFNEAARDKWPCHPDGTPKKQGEMCEAEKDIAYRMADRIADVQDRFYADSELWRSKYGEGC